MVWANAREDSGLYALLRLESDTGAAGIAEGTLKDTWSGVSPRSLAAALEDFLVPRIRTLDLSSEAALAAALAGIPENRLAKGMIETACWTMRAVQAGAPLWKLWGSRAEREVVWTVTRQAPERMAAEAADACARYGFRSLKVKGGQGVETDLRAIAEIRAAVGDAIALTVDANSHYAAEDAADYVARLAAAGVSLAEDPCPLRPDARFARLQAQSPIPILVDREASLAPDAALFLERGARAISTKPGRVGLAEARRAAALAKSCGAQTTVGIYGETALGTLVNLQLDCPLPAEQTFFLMLKAQVSRLVPEIREGRIRLPDLADLSQLVDWEAVRRFAA
ncbi:MAG: mandelate racemase/muconate lactonizing enzyme family protein [Burkholderiales bacterium]|nr:mandelate racemase/muconate lactonizing enzyme family protein [Burkholderiales bacterium]